ncbi:hypothetical protein GGE35_001148 [Rhizobium cellulosilyticum]|uniref:Propionyl-coenzyme A carboxylase alpha polypeptide n=1 Tax=Aliirhizobium cellulosilyticum TaxID=393664 RepID=A0A7W6UXT1_9HYPH|nr:hypothetical protein [Rhizobium cellulosilyticum]MBB4410678.1 hypothetical protein [Rhizobium cellulosilyticum]MBB4445366.1 hypothetical protein [Rhizobium cellulosilyticum]
MVLIPPSGLPAPPPTRGKIGWERSFCLKHASLPVSISSRDDVSPPLDLQRGASGRLPPISLLVGEMPGRAEGGNAILLSKQGGSPC